MLGARTELKWVATPDDDVRDLSCLQRTVAVGNAEDTGWSQRDRAQSIVPAHAIRDGVAGLLLQIAHIERLAAADSRVADQNDVDTRAPQKRRIFLVGAQRRE